jgi:hypothetical protein
MALDRSMEILSIGLHDEDPEVRNGTARVINSAAGNVLNLKIRADEGALRLRTLDRLPELLKIVAEEEAKLLER